MTEPREIAFEDIKVGDDITATHAHSGVTGQWRGVVGCIDGKGLYTAEGGYIGCLDQYTFTLNDRATPAEPKGLGAVIEYAGNEFVSINRAPGSLRWVVVTDYRTYDEALVYRWSEFHPDYIEVLDKGSHG